MPDGVIRPAIRVHGRKRSHRLSILGQQLLDGLLPLLKVPPEVAARDPRQMFTPAYAEIWLEIGFGDGGHLAATAAAHSHTGFIGCEPYVNGVVRLLETIAATGQHNIRIHAGDARDIIAALPANSIAQVFILFPDPWPRKRHHKRRFICDENLDGLARILRPDATLLFASDSAEYCEWTLAHMKNHPGFREGLQERGEAPITKYEAKALKAGRTPRYFRFIRNQTM